MGLILKFLVIFIAIRLFLNLLVRWGVLPSPIPKPMDRNPRDRHSTNQSSSNDSGDVVDAEFRVIDKD